MICDILFSQEKCWETKNICPTTTRNIHLQTINLLCIYNFPSSNWQEFSWITSCPPHSPDASSKPCRSPSRVLASSPPALPFQRRLLDAAFLNILHQGTLRSSSVATYAPFFPVAFFHLMASPRIYSNRWYFVIIFHVSWTYSDISLSPKSFILSFSFLLKVRVATRIDRLTYMQSAD